MFGPMTGDAQIPRLGWLILIGLLLVCAIALPLIARLVRARLPQRGGAAAPALRRGDRRAGVFLGPLRLGFSQKTRRARRHAVSAHRSFLTGLFSAAMGLVLIAFVPALVRLREGGVLVAVAFVLPTLIVAWHSRRRDLRSAWMQTEDVSESFTDRRSGRLLP